jgi:RNA polymerase sigma factor (sigma-70 family)
VSNGHREAVLRDVRTLFDAGSVGGQTDGELLGRFLAHRGAAAERAFAALVERHGPMVMRVCRSVLNDEHDAEDAFQATFLVLVRRAGSVRKRDSLGSWLYGVALRVSACARGSTLRRRAFEKRVARPEHAACHPNLDGIDHVAVLYEELGRLPERYRAAVVQCDLEGLGCEEAARRLGWPVGTVKSRLSRGRERLKGRLTRRGLAPAAALTAAGWSAASVSASIPVPPALAASTVQAAGRLAAGVAAAAGGVPASAVALAETALGVMTMTTWKTAGTIVLTAGVGLGLACAGAWAYQTTESGRRGAGVAGGTAASVKAPEVSRGVTPAAQPGTADPFRGRDDAIALAQDQLARAHAILDAKTAELREAEAVLERARAVEARANRLTEAKAISRAELETAVSEVAIAQARCDAAKAAVAEAEVHFAQAERALQTRGGAAVAVSPFADRTPDDATRDAQYGEPIARARLAQKHALLAGAEAQLEKAKAKQSLMQRLNERQKGVVSAEELVQGDAEVKIRTADRDAARAEVNEAEIRVQMARAAVQNVPSQPPPLSPPGSGVAREQLGLIRDALDDLNRLAKAGEIPFADPRFALWGRRRYETLIDSGAGKAEVVAELEKYRDLLKAQKEFVDRGYKAGQATRVDVYDVSFRLLEAEAWLEREKSK